MSEISMNASHSAPRLQTLDSATCHDLLATVEVGRLAWAKGERIMVFPLSFAMDAQSIIFHTPSQSVRAAAASHRYLSFQADDFEPALRDGWTVLVHGPASAIVDLGEIARLRTRVATWRKASDLQLVRLSIREITGRRIPLTPGTIQSTFIADHDGRP